VTNEPASSGVTRNKDNYYIVRANALEGNVVLYKVDNGKRTDLPLVAKGRTYRIKEKVPSGVWGTQRVIASGNHFEVYHNEKKLYDVEDETFKEAGKVGLWTKADSVIYLDDLQVTVKLKIRRRHERESLFEAQGDWNNGCWWCGPRAR
jgi:hypothetical protein